MKCAPNTRLLIALQCRLKWQYRKRLLGRRCAERLGSTETPIYACAACCGSWRGNEAKRNGIEAAGADGNAGAVDAMCRARVRLERRAGGLGNSRVRVRCGRLRRG